MADTKFTFQRYEKKYLLSSEKYAALRAALEGYIEPDRFYQSTVCSIYYDTDNFELIRHSIEKPGEFENRFGKRNSDSFFGRKA